MRVLLSAFGPFPGVAINPSPLVARHTQHLLAQRRPDLSTRLVELPTHFGGAWEDLHAALTQERAQQPLVMVAALGVSARAQHLTLERVAVNFRRGGRPDASGAATPGGPLSPTGAHALSTRLPIDSLADRLAREGMTTQTSNDAGAYVCNELFYRLLEWADTTAWDGAASFFHVPLLHDDHDLERVAAPLARLIDLTLAQNGADAPSTGALSDDEGAASRATRLERFIRDGTGTASNNA